MAESIISPPNDDASESTWIDYVERFIATYPTDSLKLTKQLAKRFPQSVDARLLVAQGALHARNPTLALKTIKQVRKKVHEEPLFATIEALAMALSGKQRAGHRLLKSRGIEIDNYGFVKELVVRSRECIDDLSEAMQNLRNPSSPSEYTTVAPRRHKPAAPKRVARPTSARPTSATKSLADSDSDSLQFQLQPVVPQLSVRVQVPDTATLAAFDAPRAQWEHNEPEFFQLRNGHAELTLFEGFDDLLCLPTLHGVEKFWYQIETARKVLKHFKGRVLLADEVGLGKTVEAGIILKEYVLRGMADRVLIVTPAALVGQWQEEMRTKLDLEFACTRDPALKRDPAGFWNTPRIIASIATARRKEHLERILNAAPWDLVIVDEAHHLKNRSSKNYALVAQLKKRFLLLLSATPVQNSLVELYNLVTLLKPGVFRTERDFRAEYMTKGKPRTPQNQQRLRSLMRDVMIRNTRALVDVRLPPRQALTLRPEPSSDEAACYDALCELVHARTQTTESGARVTYKHLLSAAGSTPHTTHAALMRIVERGRLAKLDQFEALARRYAELGHGCKTTALLELLTKNPCERAMVFSQHKDTLEYLARTLGQHDISYQVFHGGLSAALKDEAIEAFRADNGVRVLLSTEAGGEGRNVQFCNTLVNFDLPWNPMAIEQRIGRLHRIGQTREVFVFNIAAMGTVEDALLAILDDKLNMFELVVGEIGAILGEMDGEGDFADTVYAAWVSAAPEQRRASLGELGERMMAARGRYEGVKALDEELFGDEMEVAG